MLFFINAHESFVMHTSQEEKTTPQRNAYDLWLACTLCQAHIALAQILLHKVDTQLQGLVFDLTEQQGK